MRKDDFSSSQLNKTRVYIHNIPDWSILHLNVIPKAYGVSPRLCLNCL